MTLDIPKNTWPLQSTPYISCMNFAFKRERGKARLGPKILGVTSYDIFKKLTPPTGAYLTVSVT